MAEGILLQDLYEDFHSFKKTTENHMQNTESQFHTIRVEIQAMRRQMEAMMQQFSSLASDMDKEINAISAGPSNQGENSRQQQLITSNIFDGGRDLLDPYHGIFKVFKQSFMEWQDLIAREEEESAVEMEETVAVPLPTVPINVENLRGKNSVAPLVLDVLPLRGVLEPFDRGRGPFDILLGSICSRTCQFPLDMKGVHLSRKLLNILFLSFIIFFLSSMEVLPSK